MYNEFRQGLTDKGLEDTVGFLKDNGFLNSSFDNLPVETIKKMIADKLLQSEEVGKCAITGNPILSLEDTTSCLKGAGRIKISFGYGSSFDTRYVDTYISDKGFLELAEKYPELNFKR